MSFEKMVEENFIDIYTSQGQPSIFDVTPSNVKRDWMDGTYNGWAYNCLPLKISNEYGWVAHSPCSFSATWNGGDSKNDMIVEDEDGSECHHTKSHFAHGIMTVNTDFLIRTTPGTSLYIRGLTNHQKDLIYPLDAIVETDWLPFHFPFSFKFLKPGTIKFEKGEPLFMFFPIQRNYIESFDISFKSLSDNAELREENKKFSESRSKHMAENNRFAQKFYIKGSVAEDEKDIDSHKVKIKLKTPRIN